MNAVRTACSRHHWGLESRGLREEDGRSSALRSDSEPRSSRRGGQRGPETGMKVSMTRLTVVLVVQSRLEGCRSVQVVQTVQVVCGVRTAASRGS